MKKLGKNMALLLSVLTLTLAGCGESSDDKADDNYDYSIDDSGSGSTSGDTSSGGSGDTSSGGTSTVIPVTSITISEGGSVSYYEGTLHEIHVSISPSNATDKSLTYSSSNESVLTIDEYGVIHVLSSGIATITVTASSGVTASIVVTVTADSRPELTDLASIEFPSERFEYDSFPHSVNLVTGSLPNDASISYVCVNDSTVENTATEVGTYVIVASIVTNDYKEADFEATLVIYANDDMRYIAGFNNNIYFQNALDNDYLYTYSGSSVSRVSTDKARYLTTYNNSLYYTASSLFTGSINEVSATNEVSQVSNTKAEYLVIDSGYAYYAVNGLLSSNSGIYKYNLNSASDSEEPTLLSQGKAYYLSLYNGYLYFADGENSNHLAKISTSSPSSSRTEVYSEKINNLTISGGVAYFTEYHFLGSYISRLDLSNSSASAVKMTSDAGENLIVVDNTLYYENVDKLNTIFFGDGIYSISTSASGNAVGTKLVEGTISSLAYYNNSLYYYETSNGYKLQVYSVTTNRVTNENILSDFTAPDAVVINTGGKTLQYNGLIYFLNMYDNKTLYSYNPKNGYLAKITSNKVNDFAFINGNLYINEVTWGVNNNLYMIDLTNGGEATLINTYDCVDMCTDGSSLYYVQRGILGSTTDLSRNSIHKCDFDGTNDETIYSKGPSYIQYYNDKLYFSESNTLYVLDPSDTSSTPTSISNYNVDAFEIADDTIYFRRLYGILGGNAGTSLKELARMDLNGSNYSSMVTSNTDPEELIVRDNNVYYYNMAESAQSNSGLYKISVNGKEGDETRLVSLQGSTNYYTTSLEYYDGYVYFLNSDAILFNVSTLGNAHFYRVSTSGGTPELIA